MAPRAPKAPLGLALQGLRAFAVAAGLAAAAPPEAADDATPASAAAQGDPGLRAMAPAGPSAGRPKWSKVYNVTNFLKARARPRRSRRLDEEYEQDQAELLETCADFDWSEYQEEHEQGRNWERWGAWQEAEEDSAFQVPLCEKYASGVDNCPDDWMLACAPDEQEPHCYKKFKVGCMPYQASIDLCEAHGAHLVFIRSLEENYIVQEVCGGHSCWIGLREHESTRGNTYQELWEWLDGSPVEYANFWRRDGDHHHETDKTVTFMNVDDGFRRIWTRQNCTENEDEQDWDEMWENNHQWWRRHDFRGPCFGPWGGRGHGRGGPGRGGPSRGGPPDCGPNGRGDGGGGGRGGRGGQGGAAGLGGQDDGDGSGTAAAATGATGTAASGSGSASAGTSTSTSPPAEGAALGADATAPRRPPPGRSRGGQGNDNDKSGQGDDSRAKLFIILGAAVGVAAACCCAASALFYFLFVHQKRNPPPGGVPTVIGGTVTDTVIGLPVPEAGSAQPEAAKTLHGRLTANYMAQRAAALAADRAAARGNPQV